MSVNGTTIYAGCGLTIDFSDCRVWRPETCAITPDAAALATNLDKLQAATGSLNYEGGLAALMFGAAGARHDALLIYASEPFGELQQWLTASLDRARHDTPVCPRGVCDLIGAGPGLTPSGDDLLAGAMVALHRLRQPCVLARLTERIGCELTCRTNAISAAHLSVAARGLASETVIWACDELMRRQSAASETILRRLCSVGATSGLDGLTGVVAVLECWLAGQSEVTDLRAAGPQVLKVLQDV